MSAETELSGTVGDEPRWFAGTVYFFLAVSLFLWLSASMRLLGVLVFVFYPLETGHDLSVLAKSFSYPYEFPFYLALFVWVTVVIILVSDLIINKSKKNWFLVVFPLCIAGSSLVVLFFSVYLWVTDIQYLPCFAFGGAEITRFVFIVNTSLCIMLFCFAILIRVFKSRLLSCLFVVVPVLMLVLTYLEAVNSYQLVGLLLFPAKSFASIFACAIAVAAVLVYIAIKKGFDYAPVLISAGLFCAFLVSVALMIHLRVLLCLCMTDYGALQNRATRWSFYAFALLWICVVIVQVRKYRSIKRVGADKAKGPQA